MNDPNNKNIFGSNLNLNSTSSVNNLFGKTIQPSNTGSLFTGLGNTNIINQIKDNPFSGLNPGATVNLELVGDTTVGEDTKLGFNLGYRKRAPGDRLVNPSTGEAPPFAPYKDTVIYSVAAATNWAAIKSDLVLEIKGSSAVSSDVTQDTKRTQQGLEWGLGVRNDFAENANFHFGLGSKLANAFERIEKYLHSP